MVFTIGSLFDGSGGFPLAAFMCGGVPIWASEIEPYPIAVTKSRFPYMKHLGSVTDIKGDEVEPVDVISFGSPCQDLSVAGLRKGLKHTENGDDETTRSGLFMEAVRIIKEMREATGGKYPRFAIWENVPGAFSSNKGEDFRVVCEELIKIVEPSAVMPAVPQNGWAYADSYCGDRWSLAYRVLDAQYWGVPQRRRRIYLVLDLGGECAGEVLFKRDGLRGYFEEGRTPWQSIAGNATDCARTADCKSECLAYGWPLGFRPENTRVYEETATTLCNGTRPGFTTGVIQSVVYSLDPLSSNSMKSSNPYSGCHQTEIARTIDTTDPNPSKNQGGLAILQPTYIGTFLPQKKAEAMGWSTEDVSCTLHNGACAGFQNGVVLGMVDSHILDDQGGSQISVRDDGKCPTLRAEMHGNIPSVMEPIAVATQQGGAEIAENGVCPTITAAAGMSGNNQPWICYQEAAGFKELNSAKARSDAYEFEVAPCLSANKHDASVCVKCFDARGNGDGDTVSTITGDHENRITDYTSVVVECCIDGDKIGKAERSGGSGLGIRAGDKMYTLTAKDAGTHAVAYGIGNGQANQPVMEERTGALNCMHDQQAICYGVDCRNFTESPELFQTIQAKPNGGQSLNYSGAVRIQYVVRRLTPTECARLQGFPDDWGHPDKKTEFTSKEYEFWCKVNLDLAIIGGTARPDGKGWYEVWREVKPDKKKGEDFEPYSENTGKPYTHKTRDQMLKWYNKLHTDSSEYKMWGNGIALPNALYVMQGIADVFK